MRRGPRRRRRPASSRSSARPAPTAWRKWPRPRRTGCAGFSSTAIATASVTSWLVERAVAAGYRALCLTVDAPLVGRRDRDTRNCFGLPPGMTWKNLEGVGLDHMEADRRRLGAGASTSPTSGTPRSPGKPSPGCARLSPLPLAIKGILTAEDARCAVDHGADAHRGLESRRPAARRHAAHQRGAGRSRRRRGRPGRGPRRRRHPPRQRHSQGAGAGGPGRAGRPPVSVGAGRRRPGRRRAHARASCATSSTSTWPWPAGPRLPASTARWSSVPG